MSNKNQNDISFLLEKAFALILLKEGEKVPKFTAWQEKATTDELAIQKQLKRHPDANIGIVTGKKSGVIALDFDVKNGQLGQQTYQQLHALFGERLDTLKNLTPSGGFHLLFRLPENTKLGNKIGVLGGLDIRGDGGLIAVPPSQVAGKSYQWENPKQPIKKLPEELLAIINCGADVMPPLAVTESQRNETIFQYARKLHKAIASEALKQKLVKLAAQKCDPPLPEAEALTCLESAKNYAADADDELVLELNKDYAVTWLGNKCLILREAFNPALKRDVLDFINPADMHTFFCNRTIMVNGQPKPISKVWLAHAKRREYPNGLIFSPHGEHDGFYNLWKGFAYMPKEGDWSLCEQHLKKVICDGDRKLYKYVYAWLASAVQEPHKKPGTALVLRGAQGTGKSSFVSFLCRIFGQHAITITNPKHLTGNFNAHLKDACLVFADEAFWNGGSQAAGVLKTMITEDNIIIEHKGKDVIMMPNYMRLIIASNNSWVVPAGLEERRFVILDLNKDHMQDTEYFRKLFQQMDNGGLEAMLYDLMHHDYSGINLRVIPKTKGLEEMKIHSMSIYQRYWFDTLMSGFIETAGSQKWPDWISVYDFCADYNHYIGRSGNGKSEHTQFGMEMRKLLPTFNTSKRRVLMCNGKKQVKGYELPSLRACRQFFDELTQTKHNWKGKNS